GLHGVPFELGQGIGSLVLATGRPFRTDDYGQDPRFSPAYRHLTQADRTGAILGAPIRCGARGGGLLYAGGAPPPTFTDQDEAILQQLADHAASALHNTRLYVSAEQRRQTAESLAEVAHLVSQSLDAMEVSQRVVHHVRRLLKTWAATLYHLDPTSGM